MGPLREILGLWVMAGYAKIIVEGSSPSTKAMRTDTNNSIELQGMICGFECLVKGGYFPAIIEGDTNILIQMAKQLASGQACEKVSSSWCLANRLDYLISLLLAHTTFSFSHVRCETNKAIDLLASASMEGVMSFCYGILVEFKLEVWA